jgi:hypothetical protein
LYRIDIDLVRSNHRDSLRSRPVHEMEVTYSVSGHEPRDPLYNHDTTTLECPERGALAHVDLAKVP